MGSRANGAIYRTDLRTGEGGILYPGATGLVSVGLKLDHDGLLYIAGSTGVARVVDSRTGELVTTYQLTDPTGHFINDVILLGDRAWFTDSRDSVLYGVPRGCDGGEIRALPLTGDWVQTPNANNANGIVGAPDGRNLIVVSSTPGKLYNVDVETGYATEIALTGAADVANGDGLFRMPHPVRRTEPAEPHQRVRPRRQGPLGHPEPHHHRLPLRRPDHRRPLGRPALPGQRALHQPAVAGHDVQRGRRPRVTYGCVLNRRTG
jgi:hypothetical protein